MNEYDVLLEVAKQLPAKNEYDTLLEVAAQLPARNEYDALLEVAKTLPATAAEEADMGGIKMVAGKEGPLALVAGTYIPTDTLFPEEKGFMAGEVTPERYQAALSKVNAMTAEEAAKIGARVDQAQFTQPKTVIPPLEQTELTRPESAMHEFVRSVKSSSLQPAQALTIADRALFERSELGGVGQLAVERGKMYEDWQRQTREDYPTDPRYQGELLTSTLPAGAGSVVPFAVAGGVGGAGASSIFGALMTAQSEYESAKAAGASEETARKAALVGLPIGAMEALGPVGKKFNTPGGFKNWISGALKEAGQEVNQSGLQTLNASYITKYDPNKRMSGKEVLDTALVGGLVGGVMTAVPAYLNRGVAPDDGTGTIPEEEAPDFDSILKDIEDREPQPDLSKFGSAARSSEEAPAPTPVPPEQQISAAVLGVDPTELQQQTAIVNGQPAPVVEPTIEELEATQAEQRSWLDQNLPEETTTEAPIPATPETVEAPLATEEGQDTTQPVEEATAPEFQAPDGLTVMDPDSYERLADEPVAEGFVALQDPQTNDIFQVPQDAAPEQIQQARQVARSASMEAEFEMLRKEQQRLDEVAKVQKQLLSGPQPINRKSLVPSEPVTEVWRDVDKLTFTLDREKGQLAEAKKNLSRLQSSANQRAKQEAQAEVDVRQKGVDILSERVAELSPKVEAAKEAVKGMKPVSAGEKARTSLLDVLSDHAVSNPRERRIAIDATTGEVLVDAVGTQVENGLGEQSEITSQEQHEKWLKSEAVIDMHTHPDESSFSDGDWGTFAFSNVREMHVVTKSGKRFSIKKTPKWDAMPFAERSPRKLRERWEELSNTHLSKETVEEVISAVNEDMVKEFGVDFEATEKGIAPKGMKKPKKGEAGFVALPQPLVDLGLALHRAGIDFKDWSRAMLRNLGDQVRPLLKQIWETVQNSVNSLSPTGRRFKRSGSVGGIKPEPEAYEAMADSIYRSKTDTKPNDDFTDADKQAVRDAYAELQAQSGFGAVSIADVMEAAGMPLSNQSKGLIIQMYQDGEITSLNLGDWSLANDRKRAWAVRNQGDLMLSITMPKQAGMRRAAPANEGGAVGSAGGRRQGPPPQTPPAATEEAPQGRPESTSNESSSQTRADLGMGQREIPTIRSDEEVWKEAMARLETEPEAAIDLVKSLQERPRPTDDVEGMLLLHRKIQLLKKEDAAFDKIAASTTEVQLDSANEELARAQADLAILTLAMESTGTSTARGLRIRQQFRADDFSLARMQKNERMNNGGKPLTEEQVAKVEELYRKIKESENATKAAEAKIKELEAQLTFKNLIKEFKAEKAQSIKAGLKAGKKLTDIFIERGDAAADRLKERLKKVGSFPDVGIFKDVVEIALGQIAKGVKTVAQFTEELVAKYGEDIRPYAQPAWDVAQSEKAADDKKYTEPTDPTPADLLKEPPTELDPRMVFDLAKAYVRQGVEGMENVMDRVHADLVKFLPGITVRDVRDAFSGYGKVTFPSKEEDLVKLRQYRELARLTSQYEDVLRKQAPLRTGPQRDKMGVEARILQKKINDMMKALGIQTTSQEQQLKSAADAVKTRLKNQIEELEQAIKKNKALPTNRRTVDYDGEMKALQARRDDLRKRYDSIFKPQGKTQAEKIQAILENLDKSIEAENQLLKTGIYKRPAGSPQPTNDQIEDKRRELEAMRKLRRELYARTQPRKSPEDIALEQAIKAAKKSIERTSDMIKTGNISPASKRPRFTPTAELEALWAERDDLQDALSELRKAAKPRTDPEETRRKQAVKALEKSIKMLDERMLRGYFGATPRKATRPEVKEISDLRDLRDSMRQAFNDLKKAQTPPKDPEQVRLARDKKVIQSRMKKLQEKIAAGDYSLAVKKDPVMDDEKRRLQFEESQLKEEYLKGVFQDQLSKRTLAKKGLDTAVEGLNAVRAVMASSELSGVLRQGGFLVGAHPIRSRAALRDMVKAIKSERGFFETQQDIKEDPDYQSGKLQEAGLYLAEDAPASLQKTEEAYASRWVNNLKGWTGAAFGSVVGAMQGARAGGLLGLVTGSTYLGAAGGAVIGGTVGYMGWTPATQRAYIAFLNRLRIDNFKGLEATLTRTGTATTKEAKVLANFVNVATGRGSLGFKTLNNSVQLLNATFFAPKYVASRFQLLLLQPLWRGNARTRKLIALEYARYLAGTAAVMTLLAALWDDDDKKELETDPTNSDFLKIIWNNTRLDAGTGLLQNINFISRMITGKIERANGEIVDLEAEGYKTPTRFTEALRFGRSKLAPVPGVVADWADLKNVVGEKFTWKRALERSVAPMAASEMEDAAMDVGLPRGPIAAAAIFLGIGSNTHTKRPPSSSKKKKPTDYTAKPF